MRLNRHSFALVAIVIAMVYAGVAQQNGSAYLVAFAVASMAAVSWIHGRANLRAVVVNTGKVAAVHAGEILSLPLRISAVDGKLPCGIEITAPDAVEPVFIEQLDPSRPVQATLRLRPREAGSFDKLAVVVRSYYPLGFFTAQKAQQLEYKSRVYPLARGSLPLPAASAAITTSTSHHTTASSNQTGSDDFQGIRPYSPGDSLKHVDWKALARGRPMVVKHYTAAPAGVVELRWEQVQGLDFKPAVEQLAAWVDKAEHCGLRYALHLPERCLPAAQGAAHLCQCMEALADLSPPASAVGANDSATLGNNSQKPPPTKETDPEVPGNPLAFMLLALAAAALPIYSWIDWRAIAMYHACIIIRWLLQYRAFSRLVQSQILQHVLRLSVVALGCAFSWFAYGSLLGIEPGLGVLLSVFGGKILEVRTARDLQVLAILGWFVCLCCLLLEQGLGRSIYALGIVFLIGSILVRFRRGSSGWGAPLRTTSLLLLQATPLIALLFFFFPRSTSGLAMQLTRSMFSRTGLSDNLDPASVAELARSEEPVFRVSISKGFIPKRGQIYWRCMTLAEGNWFRWRKVVTFANNIVSKRSNNTDREVAQKIIIEPHGAHWLPALDAPNRIISHPGQNYIDPDDYTLRSNEHVSSVRRYEVNSLPQTIPQTTLNPAERVVYTRAPKEVPERVRALANSFKKATPDETVNAALDWYRTQDFDYTLEPGSYAEGASGMEDFLFNRKLGFCGHFAASFATLLRLAGIPTRIVQGYTGGEYVDSYNYYLIRQSDAHVWCEVWTEEAGWKRLDPTAELVPARMTTDLQSYLGDAVANQLGLFNRSSWYGQTWLKARLMWDTLNYQWYERVVQFDEDAQNSFWHDWGFLRMSAKAVIFSILALLLTPLLLLSWWVHRSRWHPDPAVRRWQRYCRKLGKQGLPRQPAEGPLDYSQRVATQRPDLATEVQERAQAFIQARYASV